MMKYFFTLLFSCLTISVMAEVPRLSRNDLGQVTIIRDHVSDAPVITESETTQSFQQFMRERNHTLNDNRPSRKASRSLSIEELTGAKIATAEAYNFEWNDSTGALEIIVNDYAMIGVYCKLIISQEGYMSLSNLYGDFKFPIHIDLTTGVVTIEAGKAIATLSNAVNPNDPRAAFDSSKLNTQNWKLKYWTLYAMPLSRLMGNDSSDVILGQVNEDGTISFNDDFAFLVRQEIAGEDSCTWGLSPIFRNLTLLNPNGTHKFEYTRLCVVDQPGPSGSGHGGLVPRNTKPGSTKPVPSFAPIIGGGGKLGGDPSMKTSGDRAINLDPQTIEEKTTNEVQPVYWEMSEDRSALMVYNLFGLGNRCYLKINSDGTIELPRQQIYNNGLGTVYYNNSCPASRLQDSIMWGGITLRRENGSPLSSRDRFDSNLLLITGAIPFVIPQEPVLSHEKNDSSVKFYATTVESNGFEAILYRLNEEAGEYNVVENPLFVQRLDEPYWIYLAAQAYNPYTGVYSEVTWLDYEIPALDNIVPPSLCGDVNDDGLVNINDVTALIDAILSANWEGLNYDNADCNLDENVNINDITNLIDFLLNGNWPTPR